MAVRTGREADARHPELRTRVNGVWTSGIDYTVVNAFRTARKSYVPIVGADNFGFIRQVKARYPGLQGAAITNPSSIGGVGVTVALRALNKQSVPRWVKLKPDVWTWPADRTKINKFAQPGAAADASAQLQITPWTTYSLRSTRRARGPRPGTNATEGAACRPLRFFRDAMSDQATPLLEARGVAKHYGPVVALRSADLSVSSGEVHALLGANGAGKSTLVKCLTGVTRPDTGTISFGGTRDARPLADACGTARALAGLPGSGARARPDAWLRTFA